MRCSSISQGNEQGWDPHDRSGMGPVINLKKWGMPQSGSFPQREKQLQTFRSLCLELRMLRSHVHWYAIFTLTCVLLLRSPTHVQEWKGQVGRRQYTRMTTPFAFTLVLKLKLGMFTFSTGVCECTET